MKGLRNVIYMSIAAGMMIYAIPKLDIGNGITMGSVFGVIWIGLALLIIAAHLHQIIGVDEETKKELIRINKYKKWRTEQFILGKSGIIKARKYDSSN